MLTGTEIKSICGGKVMLVDCYCDFYQGELWVKGNEHLSLFLRLIQQNTEAQRPQVAAQQARTQEDLRKTASSRISPSCLYSFSSTITDAKVDIVPAAWVRRNTTSDRRSRRRRTDEKWTVPSRLLSHLEHPKI